MEVKQLLDTNDSPSVGWKGLRRAPKHIESSGEEAYLELAWLKKSCLNSIFFKENLKD